MIVETPAQLHKLFHENIIRTETYSSSAQKLDEMIRASGFSYGKFYHEYKLPDSPIGLERRSELLWLFSDIAANIKLIEKELKQNIEIAGELKAEMNNLKQKADNDIARITRYIKIYNPDLRNINTTNVALRIHFIRGTLYGYPPENIAHWLKNYPDNEKLNEGDPYRQVLNDKFGMNYGSMRLTDSQGKALVNSLDIQMQKKLVKTDSFGRHDPLGFLCFQEAKGYYEY